MAQDAIVRNITIIGEAAAHVLRASPEFAAAHPQVPWHEMRGMRNRVVHDYFDIDWATIWDTISRDLQALKPLIAQALDAARKQQRP